MFDHIQHFLFPSHHAPNNNLESNHPAVLDHQSNIHPTQANNVNHKEDISDLSLSGGKDALDLNLNDSNTVHDQHLGADHHHSSSLQGALKIPQDYQKTQHTYSSEKLAERSAQIFSQFRAFDVNAKESESYSYPNISDAHHTQTAGSSDHHLSKFAINRDVPNAKFSPSLPGEDLLPKPPIQLHGTALLELVSSEPILPPYNPFPPPSAGSMAAVNSSYEVSHSELLSMGNSVNVTIIKDNGTTAPSNPTPNNPNSMNHMPAGLLLDTELNFKSLIAGQNYVSSDYFTGEPADPFMF